MRRRWAAAACTLLLAAGCSGSKGVSDDPLAVGPANSAPSGDKGGDTTASGYQPATVLGTVTDSAIGESSGAAASRRNPGLVWTHNDSGDEPYLYLGDIGDNLDQRREIVVYRIPEPVAGGGGPVPTRASPATTAPADAIRLQYPDGAHNAEALAVHPTTGDLYVMSKDAQSAKVYKAAAPHDPSKVAVMIQVGTIRLGTGARGLEVITGADISPDGRRVAVATYAQGYELELAAGTAFDDIWTARPLPVALGARLQGEAVAYRLDGRALLTTSEIVPWTLQQVERRGP